MKKTNLLLVLFLFAGSSTFIPSCKNKSKTETQQETKDQPVIINPDDQLRTSVNAVLKDFSTVQADIKDGVITLRGNIERTNLPTLMSRIQETRPKKVENQLIIK